MNGYRFGHYRKQVQVFQRKARYETVRASRPRKDRIKEGVGAVVVLVVAGVLIATGIAAGDPKDALPFYFYGALVAIPALIVGLRAAFVDTGKQLSPAGQLAKQQDEALALAAVRRRSNRRKEVFNRPYVRYPVGIAILAGVWWLAFYAHGGAGGTKDDTGRYIWIAIGLGFGLWYTREVSKWILGLGAAWLALDWISDLVPKMSVPAAIIVGACIIAYAISSTRK